MNPDAIVVFPAGIVPLDETGTKWRSTTYEENDAFGTLGGRDRVEAAALLVRRYPNAQLVTISHTLGRPAPSLAQVYASELRSLGVAAEKIRMEESSNTTQMGLRAALRLAKQNGWERLLFVSSGFHIPRIRAFLRTEGTSCMVECIASEPLLAEADQTFASRFSAIQRTDAYRKRLAAEARGIKALESGTYRSAGVEDKEERKA